MRTTRLFPFGIVGLMTAMLTTLPAGHAADRALDPQEQANLANFDDLGFNVYSNQRWDQLGRSHAKNIVVHYPNGSTTTGLDPHIAALKPMFVFAPDHKIIDHPSRIASGNWTTVMGTMTGTFTQPMPVGDGKTIAPTGKAFKLDMVTISR